MIVPAQHVRIVVATKPVDFRRGHDGLAATVQRELGLDPHSGVIVVFRAKRADRIKILVWDGSGLVLVYKRLEEGSFAWPTLRDGVMRLSRAQFEAHSTGINWVRGARLAAGARGENPQTGCGRVTRLGPRHAPESRAAARLRPCSMLTRTSI